MYLLNTDMDSCLNPLCGWCLVIHPLNPLRNGCIDHCVVQPFQQRRWASSCFERPLSSGSDLPPLRLAVVGHVEWVEFLAVDQLPRPGAIGHALRTLQEPAGGGAVVAVQMARLQQQPVQFFTALGRDSVGEACVKRLKDLGLDVHVAWREASTRRGVSMVDGRGSGDHSDRRAADPITG